MHHFCFSLLATLVACIAFCQAQVNPISPTSGVPEAHVRHNQHTRGATGDSTLFDASLAPFYHGVASGDPTSTGVLLWTRVTVESMQDTTLNVGWIVARDTGMMDIVAQGQVSTDASRDYIVKVPVNGLEADTYYYYEFQAMEKGSLRGRTKTAPEGDSDHLRFGVVSCSNYEAGYFGAYGRLADRNDLDAIIHLGDYIYEYGTGIYGDTTLERSVDAPEATDLAAYRARYSLYRLDPELRRAHQQHPFIVIWDDHESANDAWQDGAQNHDPATEGSWAQRKADAKQAYFEWLPIPDLAGNTLYRKLSYGNLADLIMLDTRLEGREEQILDVTAPALYDSTRTLLGATQRDWFIQGLAEAEAQWKIVGNQVMFSLFHIGFTAAIDPDVTPNELESIFLDIWDGYPAERQRIIRAIDSAGVENVVFVTGDFHCSFGFEVADPVNNPLANYGPVPNYDPTTAAGAVAVEFITPSINSANFNERLSQVESDLLESLINSTLPFPFPPNQPNPHMKYVDLDRHGYMLLDLKPDTAQADWYYVARLDTPATLESFGQGYYVLADTHLLQPATSPSQGKGVQATPAPATPRDSVGPLGGTRVADPVVLAVYPNPLQERLFIQVGLPKPELLSISLLDVQGRELAVLVDVVPAQGVIDIVWEVPTLAAGIYTLRISAGGRVQHRQLVVGQ